MLGVPAYGYLSASKSTSLHHKRALTARQQLANITDTVFDAAANSTASLVGTGIGLEVPPTVAGASMADAETNEALAAAAAGTPGTVTLKSAEGSSSSGSIQFNTLITQGALVPARVGRTGSAVTFLAIGGFTRFWDSCSSTPFLVSPFATQVVTYDDMQSLGMKAAYVKQKGALGTATWDLSGDTPQWDLTNSLRSGLGKPV